MLHLERFMYKRNFFTVTVVSHWNNVLRDMVESALVVVFKTQWGAGQSHQGSLLYEQLDQGNFCGTTKSKLFCGSVILCLWRKYRYIVSLVSFPFAFS